VKLEENKKELQSLVGASVNGVSIPLEFWYHALRIQLQNCQSIAFHWKVDTMRETNNKRLQIIYINYVICSIVSEVFAFWYV
jgi:hypothetical protein